MSILGYCFSKRGLSHIERDMPCQDNSGILKKGQWRLAIVADGVGSCKHSDDASRIAVETAGKVVNAAFPYDGDEDFLALIRIAMHSAENAVENYVIKKGGELKDYQTTLVLALYNGNSLYYGNVGDSGIIALDEFGEYHVITAKQNNEFGDVHTLAERRFEVGKVDFQCSAIACMTDGLLDWVVPKSLEKEKSRVYVPRANLFISPEFWNAEHKYDEKSVLDFGEKTNQLLQSILTDYSSGVNKHKVFGSLTEGNLKDDISVAILFNTDSLIDPNSIIWTPPAELSTDEKFYNEWKKLKSLYPSVAKKKFIDFISKCNPEWSEDEVFQYADKIWKCEFKHKENPVTKLQDDPKESVCSEFNEESDIEKKGDSQTKLKESESSQSDSTDAEKDSTTPALTENKTSSKKSKGFLEMIGQALGEWIIPKSDIEENESGVGGNGS